MAAENSAVESDARVAILIAAMRNEEAPVPFIPDVTLAYAHQVDAIAHKLTEKELASMVLLGTLINRRASRLVPVLREDQIDDWLSSCGAKPAIAGSA